MSCSDLMSSVREAASGMGLEVPEVVFHLSPAEEVYDVAARGLPGRYSHWRFGRDYEQSKMAYDRGQARIYELVVNTNPYQAYLLQGNAWTAQLLVIAHVFGHCWFFEHNKHFEQADVMFLHRVHSAAERIERYAILHGRELVEDYIDAATAVSTHSEIIPKKNKKPQAPIYRNSDSYADLFPEETQSSKDQHAEEVAEWEGRFPKEPESDLLEFILAHSHRLEDWQADIISVVREEATYFMPQRRTKIVNEGFASWTHNEIVQRINLDTEEFFEFDKLNAGVLQPHPQSLNPYSIGYALWRELERIYTNPTEEDLKRWPDANKIDPRERLLEVASTCDDASMVGEFLTADVCEDAKLYAWETEGQKKIRVTSREADVVRDTILKNLRRMGIPKIVITDGNAFNQGVLFLKHIAEDEVGLDPEYAKGTLPYLTALWGRSVCLESLAKVGDKTSAVWYVQKYGTPNVKSISIYSNIEDAT